MINIIGVRFRDSGKVYHFSAENMQIQAGQNVIVETARGMEYGHVVFGNRQINEEKAAASLKPVLRIATEEDDRRNLSNKEKSREAYKVCQEKIRKHNLEMKLIDCEYTFDNNKVLFYFTADGRIDFRELVKDLASVFKTRIELRQIGVRDETKIKGGIGICGRSLCCHTYLSDFAPVSIKMAKEQNLSLNPTKISGMCGRLMCCLKNEQETYEYLNKKLPRIGEEVYFGDDLKGVVQEVSVLRQRVKVIITDSVGEKELMEIKVDEIYSEPGSRRKKEKTTAKEKGQKSGKEQKSGRESVHHRDNKEVKDTKDTNNKDTNKDKAGRGASFAAEEKPVSGSEKSLIGADTLEENRRLFRMRTEAAQSADSETNGYDLRNDDKKNKGGKNRSKSNRDTSAKNSRGSAQKGGAARDDSNVNSNVNAARDSKGKEKTGRRGRGRKKNNHSANEPRSSAVLPKNSGGKEGSSAESKKQKQGKNTLSIEHSRSSKEKDNNARDKKTSGKHYRSRNYRGKKRNENSRNEERREAGRSSN